MSMATKMRPSGRTTDAGRSAERAARGPWADRLAKLGFVGRGLIYLIVGILAFQIATGDTSESADKKGALQELAEKPFGNVLLVILAISLAGYALWRFSEAIWGKVTEPDEKKRTARRLVSAAKGVAYAAFCAMTISFIAGSDGGSAANQQEKSWTAKVMEWPGGRGIVAAVGVAIVAGALYLIVLGVTRKFEEKLELGRLSAGARKAVRAVGTFGVTARGVVFALLGLLLIRAAKDYNPDEAQGVDGTLRTIADRPYGQTLLILAALGLIAFGVYSGIVEARYRRLHE
jgi:uncharacterized membrane protein YidH (DUF202 family)